MARRINSDSDSDSDRTPSERAAVQAVTRLYQHECPACDSRWSKFRDVDAEEDYIDRTTADVPIVHRHKKKDRRWVSTSFTVHDRTMRALLSTALAGYQSFDPELEDWTFLPPYRAFVHRWERLKSVCGEATDDESKCAATQLMAFLDPVLQSSVKLLVKTQKVGSVSFDRVWQIFPPGELAVTSFYDAEAICRVQKSEKITGEPTGVYWLVTAEYIDWNGESCGFASLRRRINHFSSLQHVCSLPIYPLAFSKTAAEIQSRALKRGRKFETLQGCHLKNYEGSKIDLKTQPPGERPVRPLLLSPAFPFSS